MHLDTRTIVIVATFVAIVPTLVSISLWATKQTCPGFGRWTLGTLLGTLAMIFLSLRGVAPDWITWCCQIPCRERHDPILPRRSRVLRAAALWMAGVSGGFAYRFGCHLLQILRQQHRFSDTCAQPLMGSLGFVNGITLLRTAPAGRGFGTLFTGIVFMLAGVAHLSRGINLYAFTPGTDLLSFGGERVLFCGYFARCGLLVLWFYPHAWRSSK